MAEVLPLPNLGDVFADVRDGDRAMRVSYHPDADILVISLWSDRTCRATFQLPGRELSRLSTLLTEIAHTDDDPPAAPGGGSAPVALAS
jgi:hypothetical protein